MEKNIHKYIVVKKGEIIDGPIESSTPLPPKDGLVEVAKTFNGAVGDRYPGDFNQETGRKLTEKERVAQGKLVDNAGVWYNKVTRETKRIEKGVPIDRNKWTREEPLPEEAFQKFDEGAGHWVVETEKKERAEKEVALANVRAQMDDAEKKIIRPMRAIRGNRATLKDIETYNELDNLLENVLRPEQERLDAELKSA